MIFINSVPYAMVVGRAAVTTTLAGAAGGLTGLCWSFWRNKVWLTHYSHFSILTYISSILNCGKPHGQWVSPLE